MYLCKDKLVPTYHVEATPSPIDVMSHCRPKTESGIQRDQACKMRRQKTHVACPKLAVKKLGGTASTKDSYIILTFNDLASKLLAFLAQLHGQGISSKTICHLFCLSVA